jgi:AbrB family looped-hinge helix DNA binding protein
MKVSLAHILRAGVEVTVSSEGRVTLPNALRDKLGIHPGSRVRFSLIPHGGFQGESVRYDPGDLWKMADQAPKAAGVMSFEDMDAARAERVRILK